MSETWTTSSTDGGILYSMVNGSLTFTNLPTVGSVRAKRATAPRGGEINRPISAASQAALTGDSTTIWFSVLVNTERYTAVNETTPGTTTIPVGDAQVVVSGTRLTINPTPSLSGGETYHIEIGAGTVEYYWYASNGRGLGTVLTGPEPVVAPPGTILLIRQPQTPAILRVLSGTHRQN